MSYIRVDPDELNIVSSQINSTVNEMDQSVRHAYEQLRNIRDRARGLDDIRNRAADLYRNHTNHMQSAQQVQRHIKESAQRFSEQDRQLSSMLHTQAARTVDDLLRFHLTTGIAGSIGGQLLPHVYDAWNKYAAPTWNKLQQRPEFNDLEDVVDLLGGFKDFDKTNLGTTFKILKDFIPDGRTHFGKFVDQVGGFGVFVGTAFTAVKIVDLMSSVYHDAQSGNYTNSLNKATSLGADVISKFAIKGIIKGAAMINPITGVVVGGIILAPKIIVAAGHLAEYMGYDAAGDAIKDFGNKVDIERAIENTIKWGLDKGVQGVTYAWNNPQQAVQDSVDFVQDTVGAVTDWTQRLWQG
jgi:hypothetical protein